MKTGALKCSGRNYRGDRGTDGNFPGRLASREFGGLWGARGMKTEGVNRLDAGATQ